MDGFCYLSRIRTYNSNNQVAISSVSVQPHNTMLYLTKLTQGHVYQSAASSHLTLSVWEPRTQIVLILKVEHFPDSFLMEDFRCLQFGVSFVALDSHYRAMLL